MERSVHQVAFRSAAFPPDPTEAEQGDGPHGMALAFWLAEQLRSAGLDVGDPFPEDFGWMFDVRGPGRVVVSCGATEAGVDDLVVTIEDVPRRFRKPDPDGAALAQRAADVVAAALAAHPEVADVTWPQGGPSST
jgi:hypothetical protein